MAAKRQYQEGAETSQLSWYRVSLDLFSSSIRWGCYQVRSCYCKLLMQLSQFTFISVKLLTLNCTKRPFLQIILLILNRKSKFHGPRCRLLLIPF